MSRTPLIVALLLLAASFSHAMEHHEASTETGVTSLDVYADANRLHLLISQRSGDQPAVLEYLHSEDGGGHWSAPIRVGANQPPPYDRRGMDPQIAAAGDHLIAVWTIRNGNEYGRGPMATALSSDGGRTWHAGPNPADDHSTTDHGMIDIAADAIGVFHLVWLDDRGAGKGLRYARSSDDGASWSANVTLDPITCECCWNTIAASPNGRLWVLYRDRDPRDMAIVRSDDGGHTWSKPVAVGRFGWNIEACPHTGGGLSAAATGNESKLYASVWTGKDEKTHGDYVLSSSDGGQSWGEPIQLGSAQSWHPDIACDGDEVAAVWDAFTPDGTAVFAATSHDGARTWDAPGRLNPAGTSADHPRVIRAGDALIVFWTEQTAGAPTSWKMRKLSRQ